MKSLLLAAVFLLCFSSYNTAIAYNALQPKKPVLHVVGTEECPYNCEVFIDPNKPTSNKQFVDPYHSHTSVGRGYVIDIIEEIFGKSPDNDPKDEVHRVLYKTMSQERADRRIKAGIYHMLLGVTKTKDNKNDYLFPSESIGISEKRFYIRADQNWRFNDPKSLQKVKLGLVAGHEYGELEEYISLNKNSKKSIEIIADENAIDLNLRKLTKNRLDVIFENRYTIDYHIKIMNLEGIIVAADYTDSDIFKAKEIYIAFSKKVPESAEYLKQFETGLRKMRESGKLDEILKKYGLRDWKR